MSQFKSQFMNIMLERGFYNQCTNEDGFDTYLYQCETSGKPAVGYWAQIRQATVFMSAISCR